jgi:DNA-binding transcriptional MerR regulator
MSKSLSFCSRNYPMNTKINTLTDSVPVTPSESRESITNRLYTVPELIRLTGMTRKQVTYWARIGLVRPIFRDTQASIGHPASFYSAAEVIKALVICELRRAGFSPRQVQQVALNLEEHGIHLHDSESYLLTDGYSVYLAESNNEVIDILRNHRQMLLLVPIHEQVAKLRKAA